MEMQKPEKAFMGGGEAASCATATEKEIQHMPVQKRATGTFAAA